MLIEACRKACTGILVKWVRQAWDTNGAIRACNTGFAKDVSTTELIMKLRICIEHASHRNNALFLNGEDLSKTLDSPEGTMNGIALRRLGYPRKL